MSEAASEIVSSSSTAQVEGVAVASDSGCVAASAAVPASASCSDAASMLSGAAESAPNLDAGPASSAAAVSSSNSAAVSASSSSSNQGSTCRCEVCGTSGILANFYSPRFCSRECRYERNKGNHVLPRPDIGIITCRECGKTGSSTEFFSAKYCSKKCRYERGGRPPAHRANAAAPGDIAPAADARSKLDAPGRPQPSLNSDANAAVPPVAAAARTAQAFSFRNASSTPALFDSSTNQIASNVAANWQLLVDYQPKEKEHALPYATPLPSLQICNSYSGSCWIPSPSCRTTSCACLCTAFKPRRSSPPQAVACSSWSATSTLVLRVRRTPTLWMIAKRTTTRFEKCG